MKNKIAQNFKYIFRAVSQSIDTILQMYLSKISIKIKRIGEYSLDIYLGVSYVYHYHYQIGYSVNTLVISEYRSFITVDSTIQSYFGKKNINNIKP
jgi:hypothetical protein